MTRKKPEHHQFSRVIKGKTYNASYTVGKRMVTIYSTLGSKTARSIAGNPDGTAGVLLQELVEEEQRRSR